MRSLVKTGCVTCKRNVYHPPIDSGELSYLAQNNDGRWAVYTWKNDNHLYYIKDGKYMFTTCRGLGQLADILSICEMLIESFDKENKQ